MRESTRIINSLLHDHEFYKGGFPDAVHELKELGFTDKQIHSMMKKVRQVVLQIDEKFEK